MNDTTYQHNQANIKTSAFKLICYARSLNVVASRPAVNIGPIAVYISLSYCIWHNLVGHPNMKFHLMNSPFC